MVFDILVGDFGILLAIVITSAAIMNMYRSVVRRILFDRDVRFRLISRLAAGSMVVLALWLTIFDNWRQFIGVFSGVINDEDVQHASDPFLTAPPSDLVRGISMALFAVAIVGGAYMFARYARGYLGPIIVAPLSLVLFYVFNTFRVRFDVDSVRIAESEITGVLEIVGVLFWLIGLYATFALLMFSLYLTFWGPAAIVAAFVYRRTIGKEVIVEAPIFQRIHERKRSSPLNEAEQNTRA